LALILGMLFGFFSMVLCAVPAPQPSHKNVTDIINYYIFVKPRKRMTSAEAEEASDFCFLIVLSSLRRFF
jgi:hypothetical protein